MKTVLKQGHLVRRLLLVLLAALLLLPVRGLAAAESPQDETATPSEEPSGGILLNFKDASLDSVLEYLSEAAGFIVVKDAYVEGRVSIVSLQPVDAEEAVRLLNTVLKDRGYMALQMGRTLKIMPLSEAKTANVPVRTGNDPAAIEPSDRLVTQVIPLNAVDAVRLKEDIASLIPAYADLSANESSNSLILTDTEANVRRVVEIVRALDTHTASVVDVRVFQLEYASATNAARLINEVFAADQPTEQQQRGGPMEMMMRRFRGRGGEDRRDSEGARLTDRVTASADDRTNTLVVSASAEILDVIEGVVRELDSNPAAEQAVFTYRLKNAQAANLETVLNNLFSEEGATQAQGRGGQGRGQQRAPNRGGTTRGRSSRGDQTATDLVGQVYVVADEDTNSLMVMTASKNFDRLRDIIAELDKPVPQVLIKVLIAEVTHADRLDLGIEFSVLNLRASGLGQTFSTDFDIAAQDDGLIVKLLEDDVTATLRALEEVGKLDVLSRPYILASDNQEASIIVGQEVPFIRDTRVTETGQTINTIEYEDIGIILSVTPHINPEGLVIMDVVPEISTQTGETVPISETVDAAVFAKTSAETRVAINDGRTIVIGGLMEDKVIDAVRKVPLLGDIPLLGALFRRTVKETAKTELLIFLTPHVAREATALVDMSRDEVEGAEILPDAVRPGLFEEHMKGLQRGAARKPETVDEAAD
jgi:general secretion pathway protein D